MDLLPRLKPWPTSMQKQTQQAETNAAVAEFSALLPKLKPWAT
jgi:hypothetical protein